MPVPELEYGLIYSYTSVPKLKATFFADSKFKSSITSDYEFDNLKIHLDDKILYSYLLQCLDGTHDSVAKYFHARYYNTFRCINSHPGK